MADTSEEKQVDLSEWLRLYLDLRSGRLQAVHARSTEKQDVMCDKYPESETLRLPTKE